MFFVAGALIANSYVPEMGMTDPIPTFSYFVKRLKELQPDFAYVHVIDPRVEGPVTVGAKPGEVSSS